MAKSTAELLSEVDAHARELRSRRLFFTALPLLVIFAVYAVMAAVLVQRSGDLKTAKRELDRATIDLGKTEAALLASKKNLTQSTSDLAATSAQLDEAKKRLEEVERLRRTMVAELAEPGSPAAKVKKLEESLERKQSARVEAMALWSRGYEAYNQRDTAAARTFYEQARDKDPTFAPAQNSLGRLALDEGNLEAAEVLFMKAVQIDANYVPAIYNRALVAKTQGQLKRASDLVERALKLRPNYQPSLALKREVEALLAQK